MTYLTKTTLAILLALISTASLASTFRCGTQLVSLGDRSFQVLRKCGQPIARDNIGYTLADYNRLELHIEEWVYGPRNGMLYFLRFTGGRLTRIDSHRDQ